MVLQKSKILNTLSGPSIRYIILTKSNKKQLSMPPFLGAKPGEGGELPGYKVTKERVNLVPEVDLGRSIFYQEIFFFRYCTQAFVKVVVFFWNIRSWNLWMRSSRVVRASDCQCRSRNSPGFNPSLLPHSGIQGAADERVLNTVHRKKGWDIFARI